MPFVDNDGVRIYYEVEGSGSPLVLMHGGAMRGETWRLAGYVEPLAADFEVILIDARGSGKSDRPHEPSNYLAGKRAGDVCAVLDDVGHNTANFMGFSMGGGIGLNLCLLASERFRSFVLIGTTLYPPPEGNRLPVTSREGLQWMADTLPQRLPYLSESVLETHATHLLDNDPEVFQAVGLATEKRDIAAYESALARMDQPVLLIAGTEDANHDYARKTAAVCRNGRFVSLPGLDHPGSLFRIEIVLPVISKFLSQAAST